MARQSFNWGWEGRAEGGMCHGKQVCHNIIKLGLGGRRNRSKAEAYSDGYYASRDEETNERYQDQVSCELEGNG